VENRRRIELGAGRRGSAGTGGCCESLGGGGGRRRYRCDGPLGARERRRCRAIHVLERMLPVHVARVDEYCTTVVRVHVAVPSVPMGDEGPHVYVGDGPAVVIVCHEPRLRDDPAGEEAREHEGDEGAREGHRPAAASMAHVPWATQVRPPWPVRISGNPKDRVDS
jgi:hypothetical protein